MSGSYHDQFEPAWPGRSVLADSDRIEWMEIRIQRLRDLMGAKFHAQYQCHYAEHSAIKVTDEAIAHAIRESHRN